MTSISGTALLPALRNSVAAILSNRFHGAGLDTRAYATSSAVISQMIDFAVRQSRDNPHQGIDVLRAAAANQADGGADKGRLLVSLASLYAQQGAWGDVHSQALAAAEAVRGESSPEAWDVRVHAVNWAVRSYSVQGADEDLLPLTLSLAHGAVKSAKDADGAPPDQLVQALGLKLAAAHALGCDVDAQAALRQLLPLLPGGGLGVAMPALTDGAPAASKAVGDWQAKSADPTAADASYAAAAKAAAAARQGATSSSGRLANEFYYAEVEADALLGTAQLALARKDWDKVEELAAAAIKAAEASDGDKTPLLTPVLTTLGYAYCRSARVTYAEGLYREAAKLLRLDAAKLAAQQATSAAASSDDGSSGGSSGDVQVPVSGAMHASIPAVLCWRMAQLLAVVPNRGAEAAVWEKAALSAWQRSGHVAAQPLGSLLGGMEHLKGGGSVGTGLLLSLGLRRALPL